MADRCYCITNFGHRCKLPVHLNQKCVIHNYVKYSEESTPKIECNYPKKCWCVIIGENGLCSYHQRLMKKMETNIKSNEKIVIHTSYNTIEIEG